MLARLLRWLTDGALAESILGDLREERARRAVQSSLGARLWFAGAALLVTLSLMRGRRWAPGRPFAGLGRDVAYGWRSLRRRPALTTAAVATIAVGIAATTAMFSVVNAVLLDLPFKDLDRLAGIAWTVPRGSAPSVTTTTFHAWRAHRSGFSQLAGEGLTGAVLTGVGDATHMSVENVSASMFGLLGVSPLLGRTFTAEEDRPSAPPVAVLSYSAWTQQFGQDPTIVGRMIQLDGRPVTVIGVMRDGFGGPRALEGIDAWMPLEPLLASSATALGVWGKLAPGLSLPAATASLASLYPPGSPGVPASARLVGQPLSELVLGDVRSPLLFLSGAAIGLLLIACANVAGLLVTRAEDRRRELAVRLALGSSRARVIRQLLAESVLVGLGGGAVGLVMADWALRGIIELLPAYLPGAARIGIDGRVLAVCLGASTGTGILFGLAPALLVSGLAPGTSLAGRDDLAARRGTWGRTALVAAEIALSLAVVVGAGLLVKTYEHVKPDHPGFDPTGKATVKLNLPASRYPTEASRVALYADLVDRIRLTPGVTDVATASDIPLSGFASIAFLTPAEMAASAGRSWVFAPVVSDNYFRVMGIPLLGGRPFNEHDGPTSAAVLIVNAAFVRRFWPGSSPLGQPFEVQDNFSHKVTRTVIGIVGDTRQSGNVVTPPAELYLPFAQTEGYPRVLIMNTSLGLTDLAANVRQHMAALDRSLPLGSIEALSTTMANQVRWWRFGATLMGAFAGVALLLAAVGLFAVVAASVAERTREIGVRVALGARPAHVLRTFVARALAVGTVGVAVGLGLAWGTTRFLNGWVVDVSPLDPATFVTAVVGIAVIVVIASYLPARRALRVDPIVTLRAE